MPSTYDFSKDYALWKSYAIQAHSRNFAKRDVYIALQSVIERVGHRKIIQASCNRSHILEIGVGGGEHIGFEKERGLENYTAVDIDPVFLDLVRNHYPEVKTVQVSGSQLPFPSAHFTTVISTAALEHIPTLEDSLREIKRVLVEAGDFLVLVPRNGSLLVELFKRLVTYPILRLKGIRKPSFIWHYENVNSFNRIRVLLTKHFSIKEESPIPFCWLPEWMSPLHFFHCVKVCDINRHTT